jgi:uncharacterized protein (DUF2267 family)
MDQLINQIVTQTRISPEQARQAVQIVFGFLKEKLPPPVASQVESYLSGQSSGGMTEQAKQAMGGLGDMFGKKD